MDGFTRYAVYFAPSGRLGRLGSVWLGWDAEAGRMPTQPEEAEWPDLPLDRRALISGPARYGFHGTLKPPFRLTEGREVAGLHGALSALAPRLPRLKLDGLRVADMGPFLALVPEGDTEGLNGLANTLIKALDGYRAPPQTEELARRRGAGGGPPPRGAGGVIGGSKKRVGFWVAQKTSRAAPRPAP
ncbi:MAG: DUF1045 domain-containing protein, partial [Pseudomonadota bacterium]